MQYLDVQYRIPVLEIYKFLLPTFMVDKFHLGTRYLVEVLFHFGCKGPDHLQLMNKNHMAYFWAKIWRAFKTNFSVLVVFGSFLKIHKFSWLNSTHKDLDWS